MDSAALRPKIARSLTMASHGIHVCMCMPRRKVSRVLPEVNQTPGPRGERLTSRLLHCVLHCVECLGVRWHPPACSLLSKSWFFSTHIHKSAYDPPVSAIRGYLCGGMQASPGRAYGARVQSTLRLEENRQKN